MKPRQKGSLGADVPAPSLADVHAVFRRSFGETCDLDAINVVLAAVAAQRVLTGDTVWCLLISGSGNLKTETVQSISGMTGVIVTDTITEGGLLSGSAD